MMTMKVHEVCGYDTLYGSVANDEVIVVVSNMESMTKMM
jgi:hypothetical protein